mgnify:CR=1 FL=1
MFIAAAGPKGLEGGLVCYFNITVAGFILRSIFNQHRCSGKITIHMDMKLTLTASDIGQGCIPDIVLEGATAVRG